MSEVKEPMIDRARLIRNLEKRRSDLWSVAGGSKFGAKVYASFLNGTRQPSPNTVAQAKMDGRDLMAEYRSMLAEKLAAHAIAQAHAKAISDELRALRALEKAVA